MGRTTFIFVSNLFVYCKLIFYVFSKYLFTAFALILRMAMLLCHAEDLKLVCCHI